MPEGGGIGEFLNPKSMFTPGAAGGITLLLTNTLGANFGLPLAWTALAISAIIGSLVLVSGVPVLQRIVFYVLNSLVIFCVAMGSNSAGRELRMPDQLGSAQMRSASVTVAQDQLAKEVAQSIRKSDKLAPVEMKAAIEQAKKGLQAGFQNYAAEVFDDETQPGSTSASRGPASTSVPSRGFFKEWSF